MNEDERGITPANVTAMTLESLDDGNWRVTIEQGNGDVIKLFELTDMERIQLAMMLENEFCEHVSFVDFRDGRLRLTR
jgi:hypothetical protein